MSRLRNKEFVRLQNYEGWLHTLRSESYVRTLAEHGEVWFDGSRDAAWQGLFFDNRRFYRWRGRPQ